MLFPRIYSKKNKSDIQYAIQCGNCLQCTACQIERTGNYHPVFILFQSGFNRFDRIFAEEIHKKYPHLALTFCVRGGPAMNDATEEDAALMGIPFPVISNGNRVPGTQIDQLGEEARTALETADVIIAKGQGNAETMYGCGYNVYYAFLIKCPRFEAVFGKPKFTPMLVRDPKK